jgi:hypothetical protein
MNCVIRSASAPPPWRVPVENMRPDSQAVLSIRIHKIGNPKSVRRRFSVTQTKAQCASIRPPSQSLTSINRPFSLGRNTRTDCARVFARKKGGDRKTRVRCVTREKGGSPQRARSSDRHRQTPPASFVRARKDIQQIGCVPTSHSQQTTQKHHFRLWKSPTKTNTLCVYSCFRSLLHSLKLASLLHSLLHSFPR